MSILISTCPKCGSRSLEHLCITTNPPIHKVRCPICNWSLEDPEPPLPSLFDAIKPDDEIKATEKSEESDILNYFSLKEWKMLEQGLNTIFKQGNMDVDLSDFSSLANKVIALRKKKQEIEKIRTKYRDITIHPDEVDDNYYTISLPKSESTTATINNINEEEKEMENPCKECIKKLHKTDCAGCRDYADYMIYFQKLMDRKRELEKKVDIDDNTKSKYRCPCNGCEKEPKDCICDDFYRYIGKHKPNNPED
jgi:hypothetical protein